MKRVSTALLVALSALVVVCSPAEQQQADQTAREVCAIIAPGTDGGIALFEKLVADVAELERLERARLDAGDQLARDAKGDR